MRDLEVFHLVCVSRLTDFNEICQNEGDGGSPNADQIWRCCVNISGYTAPKYVQKQPFSPRRATRSIRMRRNPPLFLKSFFRRNALSNFSKYLNYITRWRHIFLELGEN